MMNEPALEAVASRSRPAEIAAGLLHGLLDGLLPPRCPACAIRTGSHGGLCPACWRGLALIERPFCERLGVPFAYDHGPGMLSAEAVASPPAFGRARSAARYDGVAVDLVHRLKYQDRVELAPLLARLMTAAGRDLLAEADLLVPVPLHRARLWRRRFNQSALLAREIARMSGMASDPLALVRHRRTGQQVGLSRTQRARNVEAAFSVPEEARGRLRHRRLVLVDDVLTSGATVEAASRALLRAGAGSVDVLTFARVIQAPLG